MRVRFLYLTGNCANNCSSKAIVFLVSSLLLVIAVGKVLVSYVPFCCISSDSVVCIIDCFSNSS